MIIFVAGCRPNFVKMAPLMKIFEREKISFLFCHTGQHYDYEVSQAFIESFELPQPDFFGIQNIPNNTTDYIIVFGDVNSSRQAAEYAYEYNIKLIHIEAGLRSFDNTMIEETNRIYIDKVSDYCFVSEQSGMDNLNIQIPLRNRKCFFVGNTMIDTLNKYFPRFILLTLHRPSNVDDANKLKNILSIMNSIDIPVCFPVHHRVKIDQPDYPNILFTKPLEYEKFIELLKKCCLVVTDSGGVQEEAAWLGRLCLTLRDNTERPVTLDYGNELVNLEILQSRIEEILYIPYWDGKAAERIFEIMKREKIING